MARKLLLVAVIAVALAGCGSMDCAAGSNNQNAAGGCGTHITFLR